MTNKLIYAKHVENLRYIEYSISDMFRFTKQQISQKRNSTNFFDSNIRLLVLQLGIWSEARFNKLINEYNITTDEKIFSALELELLGLRKQKIAQWQMVINLAFRKHYNIYIGTELSVDNLGRQKYDEYTNILKIVENYLKSIIEVRNKLAHGYWKYQINDKGDNINNSHLLEISQENILTIETKFQILKYVAQIIHDLMLTKTTFERDFNKYYKEILDRKTFLEKHSTKKYNDLVIKLQNKIKIKNY